MGAQRAPYFQKCGPFKHNGSHRISVTNNSNDLFRFSEGLVSHNFHVCAAFFKTVREFHALDPSLCNLNFNAFTMIPTPTGKPGKIGEHFPVREKSRNFAKMGKVREFDQKYWKNQKKIILEFFLNTGKVREICQLAIVETLQIWDHTFK